MLCLCGSCLAYVACCSPLHEGKAYALLPEQLMRSRFSAYCLKLYDYILHTYHPSQHHANTLAEIKAFANAVHFIRLTVLKVSGETLLPEPVLPQTILPQPVLPQQKGHVTSQICTQSTAEHFAQGAVYAELPVTDSPNNPLAQTSANNSQNSAFAGAGFVEFEVAYIQGNKLEVFREISRFLPVETASLPQGFNPNPSLEIAKSESNAFAQTQWPRWQWRYLDGELQVKPSQPIGRNDLCPCGSQKKFKQCHEHRLAGQA